MSREENVRYENAYMRFNIVRTARLTLALMSTRARAPRSLGTKETFARIDLPLGSKMLSSRHFVALD